MTSNIDADIKGGGGESFRDGDTNKKKYRSHLDVNEGGGRRKKSDKSNKKKRISN
jgi:hypothetical protein